MGWFDDAVNTVSSTASSVGSAISSTATGVGRSVSNWLGSGPNTSDAATAHGGDPLLNDQPASLWGRIGQGIGDIGRGISQEGLGGVLDPAGMMDRQRAQRQLSNRFQVVDDDFVGPRQHNQVTQEEYQRIAHTFSDIRTGRGDLTIDSSGFSPFAQGDRQNWDQGMQSNIADMMMTTAGRDQIFNMSNNVIEDDAGNARRSFFGFGPERHGHTTISPLFGQQVTGADGKPTWQDPGWLGRNASTLRYDNAFAGADGDKMRDAAGNRGQGGDATLTINPGSILGLRSDVVLAHEMQHAMHHTQGTNAPGTFAGDANGNDVGTNNRERQATGLSRSGTPGGGHYPGDPDGCTENTYRAQRNDLGDRFLPREHYGHLPAEAGTDQELRDAWARHNASGNARAK